MPDATSERARQSRTDKDYAYDTLLKGLQVFEAFEGTNFEPVSIQRIQQRTGLPYDTCMRVLRTFRLAGFATESEKGWTLTARYVAFCQRAAKALTGL